MLKELEIYKKFFGEKLRKAIIAAGLNQSRLAELLKVEPPTISRWVNGHDFPDDERLPDICQHLGVKQHYFLQMHSVEPTQIPPELINLWNTLSQSERDLIFKIFGPKPAESAKKQG